MKTQLLQDIVDSGGDGGAAPAGPDATARLADAKGWPDLPGTASSGPHPPRPAAAGFNAQPESGAPPDFATAREPDWLAELMRQDAERADARHKAGRLRRRLFGWSIGAGVPALLAAGALWVIEERRVAAPLAVLAESRPAAAVPSFTPQAAPAPTILEEAVRPAAPPSTAPPGRAQADRRKREETLLQCRALGYDEGQCIRRECGMTRFGLACRGGAMGADVPP